MWCQKCKSALFAGEWKYKICRKCEVNELKDENKRLKRHVRYLEMIFNKECMKRDKAEAEIKRLKKCQN